MTTILKTVDAVRQFRRQHADKRLGFVPTMGNLHDGHLSLMRIAQENADVVVASVFVNPTQFGVNEDLHAYPRTFDADCQKMRAIGVDAVFYPTESEIYPFGKDRTLSITLPPEMTHILCGLDRPVHFQGVATVVTKLFEIVRPDVAVFGEKDFQQLAIIRRLCCELFMGIDILGGEIVREASGLAMSSRNQYLDDDARRRAAYLSKVLNQCRQRLLRGDLPSVVIADGKAELTAQGLKVEYLDWRDANTLETMAEATDTEADKPFKRKGSVLLVAARVGQTRLIDNLRIG